MKNGDGHWACTGAGQKESANEIYVLLVEITMTMVCTYSPHAFTRNVSSVLLYLRIGYLLWLMDTSRKTNANKRVTFVCLQTADKYIPKW